MKLEDIAKRLRIDNEVAAQVKAIIEGKKDPSELTGGANRIRECYNPPEDYDVALHAINQLIEGYGVEYVAHKDDTFREVYGVDYVNLGDTYTTTVVYDHLKGKFEVIDIGTIIEADMEAYV